MVTLTYDSGETQEFESIEALVKELAYEDYLQAKWEWAEKRGTFIDLKE